MAEGSMARRLIRPLVWLIGILVALVALILIVASLVYSPEYVRRMVMWGESDQGNYLNDFPHRTLHASPEPLVFEAAPDQERVSAAFASALGVEDFGAFLESTSTQAFIVIQDDAILYEGYFNGADRTSMLTSFSVAKSFDSALVGIAIDEGYLPGVDVPITDYLPELLDRDPRFGQITIRNLLMMASGIAYKDDRSLLFNGDAALTTYYPDQRKLVLETLNVADPPGQYFLYDKYHPQLVGLILERTTGMSVTDFMQRTLWDPLGMEFDGAWCLDSEKSGFEKMEAGLNAHAIDFAKLGSLFLHDGALNGRQIISPDWVTESTALDSATQNAAYYADEFGTEIYDGGSGWYKYFWYGMARDDGSYDFTARGDHGQFIYVSPTHRLVIVRNGSEWGIPGHDWMQAFYDAASQL